MKKRINRALSWLGISFLLAFVTFAVLIGINTNTAAVAFGVTDPFEAFITGGSVLFALTVIWLFEVFMIWLLLGNGMEQLLTPLLERLERWYEKNSHTSGDSV